jgi:hypothetical protein
LDFWRTFGAIEVALSEVDMPVRSENVSTESRIVESELLLLSIF